MEKLIRQIANSLELSGRLGTPEANVGAFREIIFSGMSRCGFMKRFSYLPELDRRVKSSLYLCFVSSKETDEEELNHFIPSILDELSAYGVSCEQKVIPNGFKFISTDLQNDEPLIVNICIITGVNQTNTDSIIYKQTPLAYELRYTGNIGTDLRRKAEETFDAIIKNDKKSVQKNKKGPKKAPAVKKTEKEADEKWLQPSLFDF